MTEASRGAFSERLRAISSELREIDLALKSAAPPDVLALQEFRHVLDNARLTAWTVSELLNAAQSNKDPATVLTFVAAERLRRSNQMLKDLGFDIAGDRVSWQTAGIQTLFDTVNSLQVQLRQMLNDHRSQFQKVGDGSR